jgi:hypothetical protein
MLLMSMVVWMNVMFVTSLVDDFRDGLDVSHLLYHAL